MSVRLLKEVWQASNGRIFMTREEAEREDMKREIRGCMNVLLREAMQTGPSTLPIGSEPWLDALVELMLHKGLSFSEAKGEKS